ITYDAIAGPSFVLARLEKAEEVHVPVRPGEIRIDAYWMKTFRVKRVLIGTYSRMTFQEFWFSGQPILGLDSNLLLDGSGPKPKILWDGPASEGICIEPDVAKRYSIVSAIEDLRRAAPCKQPY